MAWPRKRIAWVAGSVVVTLLATLVVVNLIPAQRRIERRIERHYETGSPDYFRALGVLLGPAVLAGNKIEASPRRAPDHRHRCRAPRLARDVGPAARSRC